MSDGLVMPSTVVIPELLSIEMHVSFSFLLYIIVKATHTHTPLGSRMCYRLYNLWISFWNGKGEAFQNICYKRG